MASKGFRFQFIRTVVHWAVIAVLYFAVESWQLQAVTPAGKGLSEPLWPFGSHAWNTNPMNPTSSDFPLGKQELNQFLSTVLEAFSKQNRLKPETKPQAMAQAGEAEKRSQAWNDLCFSRNLEKILDPNTGRFIDSGMSGEEVLRDMRDNMEHGQQEAQQEFAQMVDNGELRPAYLIEKGLSISVLAILGVALLIFILWLLCLAPILCCSRLCRCCCCCIPRRAHKRKCHSWCQLMLGIPLAILVVALALAGYISDKKVLDETTAIVCATGRLMDEIAYGAPATAPALEGEGQQGFVGFVNLKNDAEALISATDGANEDNIVNQAKRDIKAVVDTKADRNELTRAIKCATANMNEAKSVTEAKSQQNIFVEIHHATLTSLFKALESRLPALDVTSQVSNAIDRITLPDADMDEFSAMDEIVDAVVETANSMDDVAKASQKFISLAGSFSFVFPSIIAVLGILTLLLLLWQVCRPNKCSRRMLALMALLMTLLSVMLFVIVAVVWFIRHATVPVCGYIATDVFDVNSSHVLAKWYGEDSKEFQAALICMSSTGSGDLFEDEDGESIADEIVDALESKKAEVCAAIPKPPDVSTLSGLNGAERDAMLQSWAVVGKSLSSTDTFLQVKQSGIQTPDSSVLVNGKLESIYGMQTVKKIVDPWKIEISSNTRPGNLTITSEAPTNQELETWRSSCAKTKDSKRCDQVVEAVNILKKKIALMIQTPRCCYSGRSNSAPVTCTIQDLMGGVGGSTVPQNALDRSIVDVADGGKVASDKIDSVKQDVLKFKHGSNCKFLRDRMIRISSHLCYEGPAEMISGSVLRFVLATIMVLLSLLLVILVVQSRDNARLGSTETPPKQDQPQEAESDGTSDKQGEQADASSSSHTPDGQASSQKSGISGTPEEQFKLADEADSSHRVCVKSLSIAIEGATGIFAVPAPAQSSESDVTPAPAQSSEPDVTPAPAQKSEPDVTPAPAQSSEPDVTPAPEQNSEPDVTPAPAQKSEPDVTPAPAQSSEPDVTPAPEQNSEPDVKPEEEADHSSAINSAPTPDVEQGNPSVPASKEAALKGEESA